MSMKKRSIAAFAACACLAALPLALAQTGEGAHDFPLPPGWTAEDMQACMVAGTPGEMHAELREMVGVWKGSNEMWMAPGMPPATSDTKWTVTSIMDGRYLKIEVESDMPGMGPYHGMGFTGFDNVTQQFVGDWIDNHSTGIMRGAAERSPDGTTLTWTYTYQCPITNKPTALRQIQRRSEGTMAVEMFAVDPKSGVEYRCMKSELEKGSRP
jgi:hypothetical protein